MFVYTDSCYLYPIGRLFKTRIHKQQGNLLGEQTDRIKGWVWLHSWDVFISFPSSTKTQIWKQTVESCSGCYAIYCEIKRYDRKNKDSTEREAAEFFWRHQQSLPPLHNNNNPPPFGKSITVLHTLSKICDQGAFYITLLWRHCETISVRGLLGFPVHSCMSFVDL